MTKPIEPDTPTRHPAADLSYRVDEKTGDLVVSGPEDVPQTPAKADEEEQA
jgi:hypothetical protein